MMVVQPLQLVCDQAAGPVSRPVDGDINIGFYILDDYVLCLCARETDLNQAAFVLT